MENEHYFQYLDMLRESGKINMFGAAPHLAEAYELTRQEARAILLEWMQTFDERHKVKDGN
jgi:hypothetical protein